jgi:hypothetical protein
VRENKNPYVQEILGEMAAAKMKWWFGCWREIHDWNLNSSKIFRELVRPMISSMRRTSSWASNDTSVVTQLGWLFSRVVCLPSQGHVVPLASQGHLLANGFRPYMLLGYVSLSSELLADHRIVWLLNAKYLHVIKLLQTTRNTRFASIPYSKEKYTK